MTVRCPLKKTAAQCAREEPTCPREEKYTVAKVRGQARREGCRDTGGWREGKETAAKRGGKEGREESPPLRG
eukprot:8661435-Alexandrium_andersonii.AAC.1